MSFSATTIGELLRRHYPRAEGVIKAMIEAIQFQRTQGIKITDIDIINRVISLRSKVKVDDEETGAKLNISGGYPTYYPATEPDGNKVKLYLFMDHASETYRDYSGFGNHASLLYQTGFPDVNTDGPDLGNGHASRALKFDSTKEMVVAVPHSSSIAIAGLSTGFSLVMRVRLTSFATTAGKNRRICCKWDDSNNNLIILVDTSGKIEFHIELAGVTTRWITTAAVLTVNTFHTLEFVLNTTGPALTLYVDGVSKTITTTGTSRTIDTTTTDLLFGSWGKIAYRTFSGNNDFLSKAHSAPLNLSQFSVTARFRTKAHPAKNSDAMYMLSKGKKTVETAGQNLNYGIWMNPNGKVEGGFETSTGVNNFIQTGVAYNDGIWHRVVITYDGASLKIFIDGVRKNTLVTSSTPDTNSLLLYVGATDPGTNGEFAGDLDDLKVWNNDLVEPGEIDDLENGIIPQSGNIVYEENFGGEGLTVGGDVDGNIQWVIFQRDQLDNATEALAFHTNKWTKNPNVGSNKVATIFYTLATTP